MSENAGEVEGSTGGDSRVDDFALDQSLGFLVYRAALLMKQELARQFGPHDLTPEQWAVLVRLWEEEGLTQRQVADRTFKDQANVARIVRRLESKGLVHRTVCLDDGRCFRLHLTTEAHALMPELIPRALRAVNRAVAGIDRAELHTAKAVLARVPENLKGDGRAPIAAVAREDGA
ncbi:MAG: MarR family winged helix-turn-helix transcriptional regulator [Thermoleophilia bacterium]